MAPGVVLHEELYRRLVRKANVCVVAVLLLTLLPLWAVLCIATPLAIRLEDPRPSPRTG